MLRLFHVLDPAKEVQIHRSGKRQGGCLVDREPSERFMLVQKEVLGLAQPLSYEIHPESYDASDGPRDAQGCERCRSEGHYADLLPQLSGEGLLWGLAWLAMAAGQVPEAGIR